jgi:hypothetical protein
LFEGIVEESVVQSGVELGRRGDGESSRSGNTICPPPMGFEQQHAHASTGNLSQEFVRELLQDGVHLKRRKRLRED